MNKKLVISVALAGSFRLLVSAGTVTESSSTVPTMIPDYDNNGLSGLAESITLNNTGIQTVMSVRLSLDISGGFNGDYYAYLEHNNSMAVLLNRVGLDANHPYGYDNPGFDVTFADNAAHGNIHTYQTVVNPGNGPLTGTWQPDGRTADPFQVTTSSPSTALLSALDGGSANGTWTLFIADCSEGGIGTLTGWSLDVTGTGTTPVPDATSTLGLLATAMALLTLGGRHSAAAGRRGGSAASHR